MNTTTDDSPRPAMRTLTPLEARVLGVLFEKQHTVPDTYPLSLNSLASGCNQKTSRSPVMSVSESEIMDAINSLKRLSLVLEGSSSRVPRYEHNMERVLALPRQSAAILTALLLRGPQTAAELRLATARLHSFADTSSVEAFLEELADNDPPRVVKLARTPGERESRWMHLLCGEPSPELMRSAGGDAEESLPPGELEGLRAQQRALSERVERLEALVAHLAGELGVSVDDLKDRL
jgi:uncharacterized protein